MNLQYKFSYQIPYQECYGKISKWNPSKFSIKNQLKHYLCDSWTVV